MIDSNILIQTEDENLVRDVNSKALLNNNLAALREYRNKSETKQRLAKLESDMQDIKNLLIEIASLRKQ